MQSSQLQVEIYEPERLATNPYEFEPERSEPDRLTAYAAHANYLNPSKSALMLNS